MKYYKGDIVEILTSKYRSWNEIPAYERGYFENQNLPAPTIGQRFRVAGISSENSVVRIYAIIDNRVCLGISPDCVMLVKRNFWNKLKALFS